MEEHVAKTWWGWNPHVNSTPMAQKDEKRTKHACFGLHLSFLRVEWEHTCRRKTSVWVDCCKPLVSRLICFGICHSFGQGKDKSGRMLWISLSRLSPIITQPVTICLLWALITSLTSSPSEVLTTLGCDASAQLFTVSLTWTWLTPLTASNV